MKKRIIALLLTVLMFLPLIPTRANAHSVINAANQSIIAPSVYVGSSEAVRSRHIQSADQPVTIGEGDNLLCVGDFVYFGKHEDNQMVWQVVHLEDGAATLFETDVNYTDMEYDASFHGHTITVSYTRYNTYGSATWEYSDIRQWLNSREDTVQYEDIEFDYNTPGGIVNLGWDNDKLPSYAGEAGFLSRNHFTDTEYGILLKTEHPSLIPYTESGMNSVMDTSFGSFDSDLTEYYYSGEYGVSQTTDLMFLLSGLEFAEYVKHNNLQGCYFPNGREYPGFWLRDSVVTNFAGSYYYYGTHALTVSGGRADSNEADLSSAVRPACRIDLSKLDGLTGDGTLDNPYKLEIRETPAMPVLTDEIIHLIFADMAYARIPQTYENVKANGEHYTVADWLHSQEFSTDPKLGYDKKEMTAALFTNSEMNRIQVYNMVGDWKILDLIDGAKGYAAAVFQKGDQIIIAYRGSEGGPGTVFQGEDWSVDAEFAVLNYLDPAQFRAALETYRAYENKGNVTLTGHSLGGALVTYVSTLTGAKGYSFDGAAGHVIDLTYFTEALNIDFHSKDGMTFTNYTDPPRLDRSGADLIQHTNANLFPGVCYQTNEMATKEYPELFWTHQQYSNTKPSKDGTALEFMPVAESHFPKSNWYASVDYSYQGILAGGVSGLLTTGGNLFQAVLGGGFGYLVGRIFKAGNVHLGTASIDVISVLSNTRNVLDASAAVTENVIYGGDGADLLIGAAGTDILIPGNSEGDYLVGGLGNDFYVLDPESTGPFYISDGWGENRIQTKTAQIFDITALGYDEATKSYGFRIGNSCTVYLSKTLLKDSFSVVNSNGFAYGAIDTHGGSMRIYKSKPLLTAEPETAGKEVSVEGLCTVCVYDPTGNLAATYSTDEPGLFTEEFGTVYISDTDSIPFLTGTIYENWRVEVEGSSSVNVAIVGTDEENYVNRTSYVENVDLSLGEATVVPDQHLVLQGNAPIAIEDQVKTVSVTISENEKEAHVWDTIHLTAAAVFPDGTATDAIYWASSDPSILSCEQDENGKWVITALAPGEAELYAVAEDSGYYATCKVTASYHLPCNGGISCPGKMFTDMPAKGKWAHNPIDWAVVNHITAGTSDTTFSPNDTCTRAQIVTFLWRAAGSPEPKTTNNPFIDVKPGKYYYKPVLWAVEQGITSGTTEITFGPNDGCTRGQVVTFLWRYAGSPKPEAEHNPFFDVESGKYYYKPVLWALENGITSGTSPMTFGTVDVCTRAQIVTFLYRYMVG